MKYVHNRIVGCFEQVISSSGYIEMGISIDPTAAELVTTKIERIDHYTLCTAVMLSVVNDKVIMTIRDIAPIIFALLCLFGCETDEQVEAGRVIDGSEPIQLDASYVENERHQTESLTTDSQRVLLRGNGEEPDTLDPHLSEGVPAGNIIRDLFQGLTTESPSGEVVPGAASRWDISRDGKTYTFYLRPEAKWSNGDKVVAGDFVFGFRRSTDPATGSKYGHILRPILNAQQVLSGALPVEELGVSALNEHTVQIQLQDPTSYFLALLSHSSTFPMHRASIEQWEGQHVRPGRLISNGAYQLTEWVVHSHIAIDRNPYYWEADHVWLERIYYYPIVDRSAELNRFRAGELDWTYEVPNSQFEWLQNNLSDALVVSPWLGTYFLGYNITNSPFEDNLALRRALNLAVNRDLLTSKVTRFGELPSFNLIPPGIPEYRPAEYEYTNLTQEERELEAKRLYANAGYSKNNPLHVELRYNTNENHKKIALAVAAMWSQTLGIKTILINEEWKVFLQNRRQQRVTELFRAGWIGDYSDAYTFLEIYQSTHGQNDSGYNNPSYDRLLEQIQAERIPSRRARLMREAERLLLADQPILPLYTYVTKRLVSPDIGGWQNNIMDHHYSKDLFFKSE